MIYIRNVRRTFHMKNISSIKLIEKECAIVDGTGLSVYVKESKIMNVSFANDIELRIIPKAMCVLIEEDESEGDHIISIANTGSVSITTRIVDERTNSLYVAIRNRSRALLYAGFCNKIGIVSDENQVCDSYCYITNTVSGEYMSLYQYLKRKAEEE